MVALSVLGIAFGGMLIAYCRSVQKPWQVLLLVSLFISLLILVISRAVIPKWLMDVALTVIVIGALVVRFSSIGKKWE